MLFRLVRPVRRKNSRVQYFVQRVPADVKRRLTDDLRLEVPLGDQTHPVIVRRGRSDVRFSLRATEPAEVKRRQAAAAAYLETVWDALRRDAPSSLTHRQAVALAGELYRAWAEGEEAERATGAEHDPDFLFPDEHIKKRGIDGSIVITPWRRVQVIRIEPAEWDAIRKSLARLNAPPDPNDWVASMGGPQAWLEPSDPGELENLFGPLLDRLLRSKGILSVDQPSRDMVLAELRAALRDAFEHRQRNSEGDYSPDPKAARFPDWQPTSAAKPAMRPAVSLTGLVEAWWIEAKATGRKPSTYESYSRTFAVLSAFLGHDDAARVTRDDVVRFKDHRLSSTNPRNGRPISPRTVKDADLAGLKSVFGWACENGKLAINPAQGVRIQKLRSNPRRRGFTDAEARAILAASSRVTTESRKHSETIAAKRWVPWLLAYTGARVGEIGQLRKEDVKKIGDHWTLTITPDAGPVKTDKLRTVVLHPHLLELGFPQFVQSSKGGPLFIRVGANGDVVGPLKGLKNRLREFVRKIVPDAAVDPNHGWRHRFKTVCREAGVDPEIRDHIQGHRPRTIGEHYGETPLKAQAKQIAKLPPY